MYSTNWRILLKPSRLLLIILSTINSLRNLRLLSMIMLIGSKTSRKSLSIKSMNFLRNLPKQWGVGSRSKVF